MTPQQVSVPTTTEFVETAVRFAQHIVRNADESDRASIVDFGRLLIQKADIPAEVYRKNIVALSHAAKRNEFSRFMISLRVGDEANLTANMERFEKLTARIVYRHLRPRQER